MVRATAHAAAPRNDPRGWRQVRTGGNTASAALFAELAGRVDELSDSGVSRIRSAVHEYADVADGRRELWWETRRHIQMMLVCLARQRSLTAEDLAHQRLVGVRAAERGIALESVMHAIRLGCILVWDELRVTADHLGPSAARVLLDAAGPMWVSLDQLSSAVAAGHRDTEALRQQDSRRLAAAFLTALRRLPFRHDETESAARALDLDQDADFVFAVFAGHPLDVTALVDVLMDDHATTFALRVGDQLSSNDEQGLAGALVRAGAQHVGIGLVRQGLAGARQSLLDAECAHAAAVAMGVQQCIFRKDWRACLTLQSAQQLQGVLADAVEAMTEHAELRNTVAVFLEEDASLVSTGRRLHLHPNTVAYRLARLADATGLDVRTSAGTADALAALALVASRHTAHPAQ